MTVGPTPVALLVSVLVLVAVGAAAMTLFALAFPNLIDARWPTARPLSPREQIWAQVHQFVEGTFVGLELDLAKELASRMERVTVPAGTIVFRQGDAATHFFIIESGEIEVSERVDVGQGRSAERIIRHMGSGQFFGEVAILRRTLRTATVRAVTDCVVLRLPAEDLVRGAARSAADQHLLLRTVDHYLAEDRRRAGAGA